MAKDEFKRQLIDEYIEAGFLIPITQRVLELLIEKLKRCNEIEAAITGTKSIGTMRLLIGKIFDNYYHGYNLESEFNRKEEYMIKIKKEYDSNPEVYIDYDIKSKDENGGNAYKDLIKLEKYLEILIEKDETVEDELIKMYENVSKFNKLSIIEKEKKLEEFFTCNYKSIEAKYGKDNIITIMRQNYWIYISKQKEGYSDFINIIKSNIEKFKIRCRKLAFNHEKLYFVILNVFNRVEACIEQDEIDVEELIECKEIIDVSIKPKIDEYRTQADKYEKFNR